MTRPSAVVPDTSVWIEPPVGGLAAYADGAAISMISVAELQYGSTVLDPLEALARRRRLRAILDGYDVLPLDVATTEIFGVLAGVVREAGRNPRPRRFDLLIAATALRHEMPLLTRDRDGFADLHSALRIVLVD